MKPCALAQGLGFGMLLLVPIFLAATLLHSSALLNLGKILFHFMAAGLLLAVGFMNWRTYRRPQAAGCWITSTCFLLTAFTQNTWVSFTAGGIGLIGVVMALLPKNRASDDEIA
jgi:predicted ABC-type exoprotein transport system permease subunit